MNKDVLDRIAKELARDKLLVTHSLEHMRGIQVRLKITAAALAEASAHLKTMSRLLSDEGKSNSPPEAGP
jgi:hypothetical protein